MLISSRLVALRINQKSTMSVCSAYIKKYMNPSRDNILTLAVLDNILTLAEIILTIAGIIYEL